MDCGLTKRDADAPNLPADGSWSSEFRDFLGLCLEKNPARRLDCTALMGTSFIQQAAVTWQPGTRRSVPHEGSMGGREGGAIVRRLVPA